MSKQITITLSEEQQDIIIANERIGRIGEIANIVKQAKQKPYTNFDKLKDEMTIDDFIHWTQSFCCEIAEKIKTLIPNQSYREWLESEVKDNG